VRQRASGVGAAFCGVGAIALVVSTFLPWYSTPHFEGAYFDRSVGAPAYSGTFSAWSSWTNAWGSFAVVDLMLVLCGAAALAAAVVLLRRRAAARTAGFVATGAGGLGLALVIWRTIDEPGDTAEPFRIGLGSGVVVAAAALTAITAGGLFVLASD
jgi:hypothetical protein